MVNKEIVLQTIKQMRDSGVDDGRIKETLSSIGLSNEEIDAFLKGEMGEAVPAVEAKQAPSTAEEVAHATAEKVKGHLNEARTEQELRETTAHVAIAEQGQKLEEVRKGVDRLSQKAAAVPSTQTTKLVTRTDLLQKKLNQIEAGVSELKAANAALQSLMKKIIENQREISRKKK